ncbi:toxin [Streptomyces sp. NPDC018019]|uniref:toxin n=1 Tax=Streptomyces sp. NPDC018019 TaxID=3365030 RepID=UPI003790AD7C
MLKRGRPSRRSIRRECKRHLAEMPLPDPFSIPAFVRAMERARGRRIVLLPLPPSAHTPDGACGLWVKLPEADLVFFQRGVTAGHQDQIILHELVHVWEDDAGAVDHAYFQRLFPAVGPRLLAKFADGLPVTGRTGYDSPQEQRAEILADLIQLTARTLRGRPADTLGRLEESLSHPVGRRRPC